ncbi:MAG: EamA family transporter [Candidatus Gribaldobacteria bacterium]|nr:EamA family transporter [Candidatus Gribaldobacteria bacterium]
MDFLITILNFLQSHWLILAFAAPMSWALVNLIDVYFVGKVYQDELDGTIIAGLFQILPWTVLIFFLKIDMGQFINLGGGGNSFWVDPILFTALVGGFLFASSFYFYFKTLFSHNDVSLLQIIWSLTIVAVPVFSFLFWGEILSFYQYLGMVVILLGAAMLSLSKGLKAKISSRYIWLMLGAVIFLSLSMVFEEKVYSDLAARGLGNQGFLVGLLFFSIGAFLAGLFFAIVGKRNPLPLIKKYLKILLILEGLSALGNFASQAAINAAPSVSFVAAVETFVPVFILLFSALILFGFTYILILKKDKQVIKKIYQEQLNGVWVKVIATIIMVAGVYIMT